MKMLPFKIRVLVMSTCIVFCLILLGCSQEATLSEEFHTYKGSHLDFQTDISVANPHSGLYFTLSEVPATKGDRDFSDFLALNYGMNVGNCFVLKRFGISMDKEGI
jgi:hypothetical protein